MKLISRKEIFDLPIGTVLSEGEPVCINDIFILVGKSFQDNGEPVDFVRLSITEPLDPDLYDEVDKTCPADFECSYRDALFEHDQTYWVWEEKEVTSLVEVLTEALHSAYGTTNDKTPHIADLPVGENVCPKCGKGTILDNDVDIFCPVCDYRW